MLARSFDQGIDSAAEEKKRGRGGARVSGQCAAKCPAVLCRTTGTLI